MGSEPSFEPRPVCWRCFRPESVCYCAHVTSVPTKTRVVILQHPRERDVPIGTARMASLCLPNAELHVGVNWEGSKVLANALGGPSRPAALLYPSPGARDVATQPPDGPITLIVVDGTWWQARKLVRQNPALAALPHVAFTPPHASEYQIRKEPQDDYVSTIEALVHTLGHLEGDPARFQALLAPFRAMIASQLTFIHTRRDGVRRHSPKPRKPARSPFPSWLGARAEELVCVVGEANALPRDALDRAPDELLHWVAVRVLSGERFEYVVRPRRALAPRTECRVAIDASGLDRGGTLAELGAAWAEFSCPNDVICSWGHYALALFGHEIGPLPNTGIDLRDLARLYAKRKVGTLDECHARLFEGAPVPPPLAQGRAGHRLALLSSMAMRFAALAKTATDHP